MRRALGARLRAIRTQQGLSLHGVEEKSDGRWKAVVVGSYERGDRAVTVQRLAELADFYGVPVAELLPDPGRARGHQRRSWCSTSSAWLAAAEKAGPLAALRGDDPGPARRLQRQGALDPPRTTCARSRSSTTCAPPVRATSDSWARPRRRCTARTVEATHRSALVRWQVHRARSPSSSV